MIVLSIVPRLREEFPNIEYTQGKDFAWINFEYPRWYNCLRKYNDEMRVWVSPRLQDNRAERANMVIPPAVIFGSLLSRDGLLRYVFRRDDLDAMIEKIRKLKSELNEWCKVCVLILVVALIFVLSGFCLEWI